MFFNLPLVAGDYDHEPGEAPMRQGIPGHVWASAGLPHCSLLSFDSALWEPVLVLPLISTKAKTETDRNSYSGIRPGQAGLWEVTGSPAPPFS